MGKRKVKPEPVKVPEETREQRFRRARDYPEAFADKILERAAGCADEHESALEEIVEFVEWLRDEAEADKEAAVEEAVKEAEEAVKEDMIDQGLAQDDFEVLVRWGTEAGADPRLLAGLFETTEAWQAAQRQAAWRKA